MWDGGVSAMPHRRRHATLPAGCLELQTVVLRTVTGRAANNPAWSSHWVTPGILQELCQFWDRHSSEGPAEPPGSATNERMPGGHMISSQDTLVSYKHSATEVLQCVYN